MQPLFLTGAALVWAGWYSFNGGSALLANSVASNALTNTQISASTSCIVWCALHWFYYSPKTIPTSVMVSGALSGLAGAYTALPHLLTTGRQVSRLHQAT